MATINRTRKAGDRPAILASYRLIDGVTGISGEIDTTSVEDAAVWISRTVRLIRTTIRGVPASMMSMDIEPDEPRRGIVNWMPDRWAWVVRVLAKTGRYDAQPRPHLNIHRLPSHQVADWDEAYLRIRGDDVMASIAITMDPDATGTARHRLDLWHAGPFERLRSVSPTSYELGRIVMWHWSRYYRCLPRHEAEAIADTFSASGYVGTLADANRAASRLLYRHARDTGWRKLTLREQSSLGLDGQWHTITEIDAARAARLGDSAGVGQYTRDAASGRRSMYGRRALLEIARQHAERHGLPAVAIQHMPAGVLADWIDETCPLDDSLAEQVYAALRERPADAI